jgi:inward rectifier potassium channel
MARQDPFKIIRLNAPTQGLADVYYQLLRVKWRYLLGGAFFFYVGINVVFGAVYYNFRAGLNPANLSFLECCFFSVHTFSTVGYGSVAPVSLVVNLITVFETFIGLVSIAMLTGLFFSKFSQPSARFIFTNKLLVTDHMGQSALVFRIANIRSNRVMDADVNLTALYDHRTPEGVHYRRLVDLSLERSRTPIFALSFTCAHMFEKDSFTSTLLQKIKSGENVQFLASIRGLDDTFGQTIHLTKMYESKDLQEGGQFKDILSVDSQGVRTINFANFDALQ